MEPLPVGRSSPMATVNGGKLWVLGGTSGTRLAHGMLTGFQDMPGGCRLQGGREKDRTGDNVTTNAIDVQSYGIERLRALFTLTCWPVFHWSLL